MGTTRSAPTRGSPATQKSEAGGSAPPRRDARVPPIFHSGGVAVPGLAGAIQPKVVMGQRGDAYEREADAMADHVHSTGTLSPPTITRLTPGALAPAGGPQALQRQDEPADEEEVQSIHREDAAEEEEIQELQRNERPAATTGLQPIQLQEESEDEEIQPVQREDAAEEEEIQELQRSERPAATTGLQPVQLQEESEDEEVQPVQREDAADEDEIQELQRNERPAATTGLQPVQLQEENEDEPVQSLQRQEDEEEVQESRRGADDASVQGRASSALRTRGAGEPLRPEVRNTLEPRFGLDTGDVRVHSDSGARLAADSLNARAFTHGRDIWLGSGESAGDTRLMAHEVTHVFQQGGVVRRKPVETAEPESEEERAAEREEEEVSGEGAAAPGRPEEPSDEARVPGAVRSDAAEAVERAAPPIGRSAPADQVDVTAPAAPVEPAEAVRDGPATAGKTTAASPETAAVAAPEAAGAEAASLAASASPTPATEPSAPAAAPAAGTGAEAAAEPEAAPAGASTPDEAAAAAAGEAQIEGAEPGARTGPAAAVDPEPTPAPPPEKSPGVLAVTARLERTSARERAHDPATTKVSAARAAAVPPENDRSSRAQAAQVDVMADQEPKKPDKETFLTLLRKKLAEIAPESLEEMHEFASSGKAATLKGAVSGTLESQKDAAAGGIKDAAEATPDPNSVEPLETKPLVPDPADPPVSPIRARDAVPDPKQEEEVSVEGNVAEADRLMAENDIDEEQLEKANEPQFAAAIEAKKELVEHAAQVPEEYRAEESTRLQQMEGEVTADEKAALGGMRGRRKAAKRTVETKQQEAKRREEEERKKVADHVEGLYNAAKQKVADKLTSLDSEVDSMFSTGEQAARASFEGYVQERESRYYRSRYMQFGGGVLWLKDKLLSPPDEVNRFYDDGRLLYLQEMDALLVEIADTVERKLQEAKDIVTAAKQEIRDYVATLPAKLQKAGKEAEGSVGERFDEMEEGIDSKKEDLASSLVQKYQAASEALDARIKELKEKNKGLLERLADKIREIAEILRNFKERIGGLLRKSGNALRLIIKDPIGFLGNLLSAVKKGFGWFSDNIVKHLKSGLMGWLFGTLSKAGVQVPGDFSIKSLFGVALQVLGITTDRLRAKLVKRVGAKNVERVEKAWSFLSKLITEGPAGLWAQLKDQLTDFKATVIGKIQEYVVTEVVKAAVLWLVSLFNPASALLKAIQAIYNVVMFFVERIEQILQLVEAVVQSVADIVAGKVDAAAGWIEKALGRTVPVIISFLARLLGLGGIAGKIQSVIKSVQKRVDKAIDKLIAKIAGAVKKAAVKGKAVAKKGLQTIRDILFPKKKFTAGGEQHTISIDPTGSTPRLMISSQTTPVRAFLNTLETRNDIQDAKKKQIPDARRKAGEIDGIVKKASAAQKSGDTKKVTPLVRQILEKENELAAILRSILSGTTAGKTRDHYNLEGMVATYGTMPVAKKDQLTPDHQPQKAILSIIGKLPEFKGTRAAQLASDKAVKAGVSINLHDIRHKAGRTWGSKGGTTKKAFVAKLRSDREAIPTKEPERRRKKAISLVKSDLEADVRQMKTVYRAKTYFTDIGDDPKLVRRVKQQVNAGLDRIKAQDLSSLGK